MSYYWGRVERRETTYWGSWDDQQLVIFNILALLPIGPRSLSISSNFCSCVFWSCASARTELLQKGVLLVRIRTSMDRISICFFEPGDLRFRPDSGQMEEDLDVLQLALSNLIIYEQEELLEQHTQPDILLIIFCTLVYDFLTQMDNFLELLNCTSAMLPILSWIFNKPIYLKLNVILIKIIIFWS